MELTSWPDGKSISSTCTCSVVKNSEWAKIKCFPYEIISFPELVLIYNRVIRTFSLSVSCQNEWKQTFKKLIWNVVNVLFTFYGRETGNLWIM